AAGGSNNAATSKDITVYKDWFPQAALEVIFELEADRLQNLALDADIIESERNVIVSERRSGVDDNNFSRLLEQVYATAYIAHPYQFPILGWPSDIRAWTAADLVNYYRAYYAPNNCTMVFTGDVTAEAIFELAEDYLGGIPAQAPPPPVRTTEPRQEGVRRITIETATQTPLLHLAFHAGRATDKMTLPLLLLLDVLAGGDSSRLHRLLVEEQQAAVAVAGWHEAGLDPGLAYFYVTLSPGGAVTSVEATVLGELQRVIDEGVTAAELAKAKNRRLADYWRGLATIDGKAEALGDYELFHGSYEKLFEQPAAVEAVTLDDLRNAAAAVFRRSNMTVGVLQAAADSPSP
ncbi:MAG: insulinase family protein, partial [Gammaproteobacteria bacterium]|nr:insulinase family protein [Gammaproteobacteria bacterium]